MLFVPPGKGVPGGPADARTQQPSPPIPSFLPQPHVRKVKSTTLAACPWLSARRSALEEKWSFPFFSHVRFSSMCWEGGASCSLNISIGSAAQHHLTGSAEGTQFRLCHTQSLLLNRGEMKMSDKTECSWMLFLTALQMILCSLYVSFFIKFFKKAASHKICF